MLYTHSSCTCHLRVLFLFPRRTFFPCAYRSLSRSFPTSTSGLAQPPDRSSCNELVFLTNYLRREARTHRAQALAEDRLAENVANQLQFLRASALVLPDDAPIHPLPFSVGPLPGARNGPGLPDYIASLPPAPTPPATAPPSSTVPPAVVDSFRDHPARH